MTELTDLLARAWAHLHQSAEIRDTGFRMVQIATLGLGRAPELRTVVLRGADPEARTVRFHTDARSPKIKELRNNPAVSLVSYNRNDGQQIRLQGHAEIVHDRDVAKGFWNQARDQSKICYRAKHAPGARLSDPASGFITETMRAPSSPEAGFENFCPVIIRVERVDWLDLAISGHQRAVFVWDGAEWCSDWVAP